MPTAHIEAAEHDFAPTVLMPGDPLRARHIATTFLDDLQLVTAVRNMEGYTGTYRGCPVSVMGSGMGMPSIGIYSHELFTFYHVENIIRIGSAGSFCDKCRLGNIVLGQGASTDSAWYLHYRLPGALSALADWNMLLTAHNIAKDLNLDVTVGNILSSDVFYSEHSEQTAAAWPRVGVYCCDMETAALYTEAVTNSKHALSVVTIVDELFGDFESLGSIERQKDLNDMAVLALETAAAL